MDFETCQYWIEDEDCAFHKGHTSCGKEPCKPIRAILSSVPSAGVVDERADDLLAEFVSIYDSVKISKELAEFYDKVNDYMVAKHGFPAPVAPVGDDELKLKPIKMAEALGKLRDKAYPQGYPESAPAQAPGKGADNGA